MRLTKHLADSKATNVSQGLLSRPIVCRWLLKAWISFGFWILGFGISPTFAQAPINDLIFTVGTTIRDQGNQDWAYLIVGSSDPLLLQGKRFAVYGKAGDASSAGTYSLRATLFRQTDPAAINAILTQSVGVGEDLSALGRAVDFAVTNTVGVLFQPLPQQTATLIQAAATNQQAANWLRIISLNHPGMRMVLGQAYAEPIPGISTYEVREVNAATGLAGDVLGRVTITPGAPIVLPAPGRPFQLMTNHPSDHLTVKLRWGTPDALRRLMLLGYGYNVWRMGRAQAEAAGYHVTPPSVAQLHSNPNFIQANEGPVITSKEFNAGSGAGAADDPADRTTYFLADSNHRSRKDAIPFTDGQEFYYFATARDILGRDGLVSQGGLGRACRRIPPIAPTDPAIRDEPKITDLGGGLTTNEQRFRILWKQNTNAAELVNQYWIYRWPNPGMAFTNDSVPASNRVGIVDHVGGTNQGSFLDDLANSPKIPGLSNYWYTIRAVSLAACDPLLSPHSPPVSGVLRRRDGPEAADGRIITSCGTPAVMFTNVSTETVSLADTGRIYFRFTCERRDPGIAWVEFTVTNMYPGTTQFLGRIYFPADGNVVPVDYTPRNDGLFNYPAIVCRVGTENGLTSRTAVYYYTNFPADGQRSTARFYAGQVLLTAPKLGDPLLDVINSTYANGTYCVPAINPTSDITGTITMRFDFLPPPPVLVQVMTNGSTWTEVGIALPNSNGVYSISYPACLFGPIPPIRGCLVNLPADTDCGQHVARAADSGPVAPIQIRFRLKPRTREYRLYRQVNDGALTLLSQGAAQYNAALPSYEVVRSDDAMPVSPARLCYYVQLLDEHGNPSPMALIGCSQIKPPLPVPVLAEPVPAGDVNNPQVALKWFCPTAGVHRFGVMLHRLDDEIKPSGVTSSKLLAAVTLPAFTKHYITLNGRLSLVHFSEITFTQPIGPNFGPGPAFNLNASVEPNVNYQITVNALDAQGSTGAVSVAWEFTWRPPVATQIVAWPFRPLPTVATFHPAIQAKLMSNYVSFDQQLRIFSTDYPVGIRIGAVPWFDGTPRVNRQKRNLSIDGYEIQMPRHNANFYLFHRNGSTATSSDVILPVVLYRQQITNINFPRVSGDISQVSPMIEKIAVKQFNYGYEVMEPLIARSPDPEDTMPGEARGSEVLGWFGIYLLDSQPVIGGASYRYYIVRFKDNREVDQIIPAGDITIP